VKIFLKPGQIYISHEPAVVSTILGSCVAFTIFNSRSRVGGICHAQLPKSHNSNRLSEFLYVDTAIAHMLKKFAMMGIQKHEMEMKLFGGAELLDKSCVNTKSVGHQNVQLALEIIENENLKFILTHVGGDLGRKIKFHTNTGMVLLKPIKKII
jgi:chemotaxis protein CheD